MAFHVHVFVLIHLVMENNFRHSKVKSEVEVEISSPISRCCQNFTDPSSTGRESFPKY